MRYLSCIVVLSLSSLLLAAGRRTGHVVELVSDEIPAGPKVLSDHVVEMLAGKTPQEQAEILLTSAINHQPGAIEQIAARVDSWRGSLKPTPEFNLLFRTAINSNDLRVRAAAFEVDLAAYNVAKTTESVDRYTELVRQQTVNRHVNVWVLGLLGSRGVETDRVLHFLLGWIHDPDPPTRKWTLNALSLLGVDEAIPVLLRAFRYDPDSGVRETAGCNLAQCGMFDEAQRMKAVPELLNYADDPGLDPATRRWVFHALRDITDQRLGEDAGAWRHWYNTRVRTRAARSRPRLLLRPLTLMASTSRRFGMALRQGW